MTATIIRIRTATPKRWQAALQRAFDSGITLYQIAGTGEAVVTSQREPGTAYRTDGTVCDCAAHTLSGDPVCAHRALYWYSRGVLELDPEPEPPAPLVTQICPDCSGDGYRQMRTGGHFSDWWAAPCRTCAQSGRVAVAVDSDRRAA